MAAVDTSTSAGLESAEFDFVVVGGGTSGLTVASRLTENEGIRVLVLEAGQNRLDDPKITVPGLAASTYSDPDYDWCVTCEPQVCSCPDTTMLGADCGQRRISMAALSANQQERSLAVHLRRSMPRKIVPPNAN